jgi:tRNA-specific 2-thiouridylase
VSGSPPEAGRRLSAKVRYRQGDQLCQVLEAGAGGLLLEFEQPQRAVTAGQSVVLYDGESCLGGGIIDWADTPPALSAAPIDTMVMA